jgi:hypothetical protein
MLSDLVNWSNNPAVLQLLQTTAGEDGRITCEYFDTAVLNANSQRFVRFQFNVSPH